MRTLNAEPRAKRAGVGPIAAALMVLLAVLYLLGWLVGWGAHWPPMQAPAPLLLLWNLCSRGVWPLVVSIVIFGGAASVGLVILKLLRCEPRRPLERLLFAVALGLGARSYLTLALGYAGQLSFGPFWGLSALLLAVGWRPLVRTLRELRRAAVEWTGSWSRFEWALAAIGAGAILIALLCGGTPVVAYDTLEYHLGAPAEYLADGRVHLLRHNVYACFPELVEMLYLEGIVLAGGKVVGMAVAVLTQVLFGVLSACLVGAIAGRFARRQAALPAAVFFLSCPLLIGGAITGYITLARCFYKAAALLAVMCWVYEAAEHRRKWLVLGGLACGLAVAVKYTAAATLCVPLGVLVLVVSVVRGRGLARRLGPPVAMAALAVAAVLPWLVRNALAAGNPFFPLLYGVFGARDWWSAQDAARFARAHAPMAVSEAPLELWRFLTGFVGGTSPEGLAGGLAVVFVPVLVVALVLRGRRRAGDEDGLRVGPLALLGGYWVAFVLVWGLATHGIARFLAPTLVPLCVLSAAGFSEVWRDARRRAMLSALVLLGGVLALLGHLQVAESNQALAGTLRGAGLDELTQSLGYLKGPREYYLALQIVNGGRGVPPLVPAGGRLMLVGEARTYYFNPRLRYAVVFGDHPIEPALAAARRGDWQQAEALLRGTGATHVLINWLELRRLATSSGYLLEGEASGYLPDLNWRDREPLEGLMHRTGRRVAAIGAMPWPQPDSETDAPLIEIYALNP